MQIIPRNAAQIGGTIAVGAGIVLLAPIVMPIVAGLLKPVAKAAIKGGLIAYNTVKVTAAETLESLEDIAAEAQAELAEKPAAKGTAKTKKSAKSD